MTREEFGFQRTTCDCRSCVALCRVMSGYLIPEDLDRLSNIPTLPNEPLTEPLKKWAVDHIMASPGALVAGIVAGEVVTFRIPTLVPRRLKDQRCHWLDSSDHCLVHPEAPFGCAFGDSHMDEATGDRISKAGLKAVYDAWHTRQPTLYARLWTYLYTRKCRAQAPEEARKLLPPKT